MDFYYQLDEVCEFFVLFVVDHVLLLVYLLAIKIGLIADDIPIVLIVIALVLIILLKKLINK